MSELNKIGKFIKSILNKFGWDLRGYQPRMRDARTMLLNQKKIGLALDVGALIGGYAIELRNYGFRGTIISFEPVADSFLRLTQKTQKDRLWEAYQLALGPKEGTISLNVGDKIWTSSVLDYSAAYKGVDPGLKSQPQEAKMVRLDDWTFRNRLQEKRMFIKLDVQGSKRVP